MKTFKNFFSKFFATEQTDYTIQNTEYHKETMGQRPSITESDYFETLPPMEYYLLSAHFFMP